MLSRDEIASLVEHWLEAWNRHDLKLVLDCMADDVVFEHWNTRITRGKIQLERLWQPWFAAHGDFRFDVKSVCIDETEQTCTFEWRLEWPSLEANYHGQRETREGIDIIKLRKGEIVTKRSYISTLLMINGAPILLKP
jgi:ketosteroid isomerase-like protein